MISALRLGAAAGRRDHAKVVRLAEEALARDPDDVLSMNLLANAREELGDADVAADLRRRVVSLDPENLDALRRLANHHARNGETELACEAIRRALAIEPPSIAPASAIGRWLYRVTGLQQKLDQSLKKSRSYDKRWRRWAEGFLATWGEEETPRETVN